MTQPLAEVVGTVAYAHLVPRLTAGPAGLDTGQPVTETPAQHIARTTEPVDCPYRRLRLTLWHLPPDEWHTILTQLPPVDGDHSTDPGRDVHLAASAHIWTTITGSE
ncbi:hypothetical protein [Kitasatospora sp. NPDC092286]|uniref:hypothetical protein n=1 Tax=Kitasatospora sp. NPDC092286 TaxID=3364087 RepID=UPI003806524F